jgi:hypothetical protein
VIVAASTAVIAEAQRAAAAWVPGWSALEEERREVYESVVEAARRPDCDIDREAACALLLRHLASTAKKRASSDMM